MSPRLTKESRSLLLPWSAVMVAGIVPAGLPSFLMLNFGTCAMFIFFVGTALVAAMSFGTEFQQRTLPLLLSQPFERARLWRDKLLVLTAATVSVGVIYWLSQNLLVAAAARQSAFAGRGALLSGLFLLATACSSCFWTLVARSTIGGMILSLGSEGYVALGASLAFEKICRIELSLANARHVSAIVAFGLIYSAVFLWLGWRSFARLELRDVVFGQGGAASNSAGRKRWWLEWLRCRPVGGLLNLIRKELRLQKAVFVLAVIFTVCWLILLVLLQAGLANTPARMENFQLYFNVLTGIFVPLSMLLAGCIAFGEEKPLGLTAWHLTLPVSAWRQWLVKLVVVFIVGMAIGVVLPSVLAWITPTTDRVGLVGLWAKNGRGATVSFALAFVALGAVSFWVGTLFANTVQALLATVIFCVALGMCVGLGVWCASELGGLETELITSLMARFQWVPHSFPPFDSDLGVTIALYATLSLATITQSARRFRRAEVEGVHAIKSAVILLATAFVIVFWGADLGISIRKQSNSKLVEEVGRALRSLAIKPSEFLPNKLRPATLQELCATGKLSDRTKTWLRNTRISFTPVESRSVDSTQVYHVRLHFPNGNCFYFNYHDPKTNSK